MATLPPLSPNGDSVNGSRNWSTQSYLSIDDSPDNPNDTFDIFSGGTSGVITSFLMSSTPSDFSVMDTCRVRIYGQRVTTDDLVGVSTRIVTEANGTILAADDSSGTLVSIITLGTSTTAEISQTIPFNYINPAATKANWDDARVELRFDVSQSMSADAGRGISISALEITGTYTQAAPPENYTQTKNDPLGLTDAVAVTQIPDVIEALGLTDAIAQILNAAQTQTDALGMTDGTSQESGLGIEQTVLNVDVGSLVTT